MLIERLRIRDEKALLGPAMICATVANANRDPKLKPEPFTALDFLPGAKSAQPKGPTKEFVLWAAEGIGEYDPEWDAENERLAAAYMKQVETLKTQFGNNIQWK